MFKYGSSRLKTNLQSTIKNLKFVVPPAGIEPTFGD